MRNGLNRPFAILLLCVSVAVGCDQGEAPDPTYEVTGTVTFDGDPLPEGTMVLDPAEGQGSPVMGAIENGKFAFQAPAGKKIVRISASRETGEQDQYGGAVSESYIPDRYNRDSELTMTVEPDGENQSEFALEP